MSSLETPQPTEAVHFEVRRRRGSFCQQMPEGPANLATFDEARRWAEANWTAIGMQVGLEAFEVVEVKFLTTISR